MAVSTIGYSETGQHYEFWIEQIKALGRPLTAIVLIVIVWTLVVGSKNPLKSSPPPVAAIGYVVFLVYFGLKLAANGFLQESIFYFLIAIGYWYLFGFLLVSRHIRPPYTPVDSAYAIGLAHVLVVLLNIVVLVLVGADDWWTTRSGILAVNPNTLGYAVAITSFCVPILFMAILPGNMSRVVAYAVVSVMALVLVLVSGSRGATIVLLLGLLFGTSIVWKGKGRLIVSSLLVVVMFGIFQWWEFAPIERTFIDRLDTRSHIFLEQWRLFTTFPVFGAPWEDPRVRFGENTYLGALAQMGVVGAVAVYMFLFGAAGTCVARVWRKYPRKRNEIDIALMLSVMAVLAAGTVEALVLGVVGLPIFLVLIVAAALRAKGERSEYSVYRRVR